MKRIGLTLGKFAPLHRGHMYMIESALAETDELYVLIYDSPEYTSIPLEIRAGWIRRLYPKAKVLEAWDGPMEVGNTEEIQQSHENYVLGLLSGKKITDFFSGEFYGEHMSQALGAEDRRIDPKRNLFPISGTQIRKNPYKTREFIHPIVYKDLILNIVFVGAPSTGKTTLCERLAKEYETVWMPEYGREYWEKNQSERRLTPAQLLEIANGHLEREEVLLTQANRYLFTDTNALTTAIFAYDYHGQIDPKLAALTDACSSRYDLFFLCDKDIPYEDTWDRSGTVKREIFQKQIEADMRIRKIPYIKLSGTLETRIERVKNVLEKIVKFGNIADFLS